MGIKCLLVRLLGIWAFSMGTSLQAQSLEEQKKAQMIEDLSIIRNTFRVGYAPLEWKKNYAGWDIDQEFEKSKKLILDTPQISVKDFQEIVKNFIASTRDYHADVLFYSTEKASLPFGVKSAEGRYFIDWIDPHQMPFYFYEIHVGDELIAFDERPIEEVIKELKEIGNRNSNPFTDQALAEMKLTSRDGRLGDRVPRGAVSITVRSVVQETMMSYQLIWNYTPEKILSLTDFFQSLHILFSHTAPSHKRPKTLMMNVTHREMVKKAERDGALGARKSFVPILGPRKWVHDEVKNNRSLSWYAYIYETPQGQSIGYIRIPHYVGKEEDSKEFGELLSILEEKTDALVIDQVHNVGGYVTFQYELASMLAMAPLKTPKHRIKITQKEVMEAYQILELIESIQSGFDLIIAQLDEEDENEEPLNYQYLLFLKEFYEFIINEWNAGHALTHPTHLEGCDWIHPHCQYRYTKPILMLINELDFSGGDFMPAMMQDNRRALLFGKRTSGAGGFVFQSSFPNQNGISGFSYTGSIAERPYTFQKIENLGVTPDVEYNLTIEDLQNGYQGYLEAVNKAVQLLLEK